MKKLFFILLVLLSVRGLSQPIISGSNGTNITAFLTKGVSAADSGYWWKNRFTDTSSANRGLLKTTPGLVIRVGSELLIRNNTATKWNNFLFGYKVDTMYRINDSTVGYTINGVAHNFQILGSLNSGGGGPGSGIISLNTLTPTIQSFAVGTSGLSPNILSAVSTHTFNYPLAQSTGVTNGGISNSAYLFFTNKLNLSDTNSMLGNYLNNVGYGLLKTGQTARWDSATAHLVFMEFKDSAQPSRPNGYLTRTSVLPFIPAPFNLIAGANISLAGTYPNITISATGSGGGGIVSIGTLDSQPKSANGAVISGTSLFMQTPDTVNGYPGLMTAQDKRRLYDSVNLLFPTKAGFTAMGTTRPPNYIIVKGLQFIMDGVSQTPTQSGDSLLSYSFTSGGSTNIYNSDGTLTGARSLSGSSLYGINFDSLNNTSFRIVKTGTTSIRRVATNGTDSIYDFIQKGGIATTFLYQNTINRTASGWTSSIINKTPSSGSMFIEIGGRATSRESTLYADSSHIQLYKSTNIGGVKVSALQIYNDSAVLYSQTGDMKIWSKQAHQYADDSLLWNTTDRTSLIKLSPNTTEIYGGSSEIELSNSGIEAVGVANGGVAADSVVVITSGNILKRRNASSFSSGVTPAALTKADDTNVTLTLGGTPSTALLQATSITAGWTGVLSIARGGTNNGSLSVAAGTVYYGDGTKLIGLAPGNANQILHSGTTPSWKDTTAISAGGTPAGNYGNVQINRNGAFATPASDTLGYTPALGLSINNRITLPSTTSGVVAIRVFPAGTIAFGPSAGLKVSDAGADGIAIGSSALSAHYSGNSEIAIGKAALANDTTGTANVYICASCDTRSGIRSTAVGSETMQFGTTNTGDATLGYRSLNACTSCATNLSVGTYSGESTTTGFDNTFVGTYSGGTNTTGARNVYLGFGAGYQVGNGSNNFSIANYYSATNSMLWGAFGTNNKLAVNVPEGTSLTYTFDVNGKAAIRTIDSTGTGTAINMLYQDPIDGQIKKAAVPGGGGGGTPAGNYGDLQINRNGVFATPASDSLIYTTTNGLTLLKGVITMNTTGSGTTVIKSLSSGSIFFGPSAGLSFTGGNDNIGIGGSALASHISGASEIAIGKATLASDTTGIANVAVGASIDTRSGVQNSVFGSEAMQGGTTGSTNSLFGYRAGNAITTGGENVSMGVQSLESLSTGIRNTAIGKYAAGSVTTGSSNVAIGWGALFSAGNVSNSFSVNNNYSGTNAMLWGTFNSTANMLGVNYPEATTLTNTFQVNGTILVTGHTTFEGVASTGATGTGNIVYSTSPTFVTPLLGTPTSGVLTNTTGYLLNNIAAATGTNTINNASFQQTWQWNSTTGIGLQLSTSTTAGTDVNHRMLDISMTGANAASNVRSYGIFVSNGHTGTGASDYGIYIDGANGITTSTGMEISLTGVNTTNTALLINSSNSTTNKAIIVQTGKVGIGTTSPDSLLHLVGGFHTSGGGVRFEGIPNGGTTTDSILAITSTGQLKKINASSLTGGGGGSPGGSSGQFQYNSSGSFAGAAGLIYATSGDNVTVTSLNATDVPFVVKGAVSQSGNLMELRNSSSTVVAKFKSGGGLEIGGAFGSGSGLDLGYDANNTISHIYSYTGGARLMDLWSSTLQVLTGSGATQAMYIDASQNVGIGTSGSPNSLLHVQGSFATGYVAKTANYTATIGDYTITGDASGGNFQITLPTAAGITGRIYVIKSISTGTVTVGTTSSQTIDGSTTKVLNTQYAGVTVQSTGANWIIISTF